jgi:hypothetical protein
MQDVRPGERQAPVPKYFFRITLVPRPTGKSPALPARDLLELQHVVSPFAARTCGGLARVAQWVQHQVWQRI